MVREEEEKMHGEWRGLRFNYLFNVIDFFIFFLKKNNNKFEGSPLVG